jgi:dihydroorotate dehydrogenase electron transfer subunit
MLAKILRNENVFRDYYLIELMAGGIGKAAQPGQFFMVKVGTGTDPLLRRPFSLHKVVGRDKVLFLYKDVGRGTRLLARMAPQEVLDVIGPLGRGFKVGREVKHALLVAGGIGVAPLLGLASHLSHNRPDVAPVAFIGGRGRDDVLGTGELRGLKVKTYISTEDGSLPRKGFITASLEEYINKHKRRGTGGWAIFSCGPTPMLRSVAALAMQHGIKNYASLEANMACGVGACMGCVVKVIDEEHDTGIYKKVCDDGPVFDADTVMWE